MLTYPKSQMREFPKLIFLSSDLGRRADSRWALLQISSYFPSEISETRGPTGVKFCTVVSTWPVL